MPSAEVVIHPISGFACSNMPSCDYSDSDPDNQAKAHGTNGAHLERRTLEDVQAEESEHCCDRRRQTYGEHDRPTAPHGDSDAGKNVCEPRKEIEPQDEGDRISCCGHRGGAPKQRSPTGYDSQKAKCDRYTCSDPQ